MRQKNYRDKRLQAIFGVDSSSINCIKALTFWLNIVIDEFSIHTMSYEDTDQSNGQVEREESVFDSVLNVIGFTRDKPLVKFGQIWYQVFLWALFSSLFVHIAASGISFCRLRSHKIGRWVPVVILGMGVISPLTGGVLTSAAVAGVYISAGIQMPTFYAFLWGVGQTVILVVISFTRILATL